MNAPLPPKPKIDIRQYLNKETAIESARLKPKKVPPPPVKRPEAGFIQPKEVSVDPIYQAPLQNTTPKKPTPSPPLVPPSRQTPQRNYAPKPTHTSVPLKTHMAENRPPSQIPTSFLSSKSRKLLAANDRYICVSTASKTLLYSWRSSSLVWEIKTVALTAAFVNETQSLWLGTVMGRILVLDVHTGNTTQVLDRGHVKPVTYLNTSRHGIFSLSSDDGKLNVWSPVNTGNPVKVSRIRGGVSGKAGLAASGGFSSNYLWMCRNRQVEVYQPVQQVLPLLSTSLPGRGTNLGAITSVAAFGDLAFFGQNDGFISVFKKTQQLGVINGGIYTITALTAPSSTELWAGTRSGEILIFSLQTTLMNDEQGIQLSASLLRQWKAHSTPITQITLAESKAAVLSVDRNGTVLAWNSTPSDILPTLPSNDQKFDVEVVTWNVGACTPRPVKSEWFLTQRMVEADIVVFGLQEVVELENTSQHALNMVLPSDAEQDREHLEWEHFLQSLLVPYGLTLVVSKSMVGIMTCLFVKREKVRFMSNIKTDVVKTGIGGAYGNKGGVLISFDMANMSWCFANSHLAAGHSSFIQRNKDASQILSSERLQTDVCFFFGDTNYRINAAREQAEQIIKRRDWVQLRKHDQLLSQILKIPSFCLGRFQEGELNFPPTYKYDRGTDIYDSSDKKRIPSWCDRILFRGKSVLVNEYDALSAVTCSDHKPVVGSYVVPLLI